MTYATIRKLNPNLKEGSEGAYNRAPPIDQGTVNWEAFSVLVTGSVVSIGDLSDEAKMAENRDAFPEFLIQAFSNVFAKSEGFTKPNERTKVELFAELSNLWHKETDYLSSPSRITSNENYLKIISLGSSVIQFILQDLKERGGYWYLALRVLSGEDPVPLEAKGNIEQMKQIWLSWGRDRGYIE